MYNYGDQYLFTLFIYHNFYFYCSNPEFQKSMKEFGEKLGVVKEDLKVR